MFLYTRTFFLGVLFFPETYNWTQNPSTHRSRTYTMGIDMQPEYGNWLLDYKLVQYLALEVGFLESDLRFTSGKITILYNV